MFSPREKRLRISIYPSVQNNYPSVPDNFNERVSDLFSVSNIANTLSMHGHTHVTSYIVNCSDHIEVTVTVQYRNKMVWDIAGIRIPNADISASIVYER